MTDPRMMVIPDNFLPDHSRETVMALCDHAIRSMGKVRNNDEGRHKVMSLVREVLQRIEERDLVLCVPVFTDILHEMKPRGVRYESNHT